MAKSLRPRQQDSLRGDRNPTGTCKAEDIVAGKGDVHEDKRRKPSQQNSAGYNDLSVRVTAGCLVGAVQRHTQAEGKTRVEAREHGHEQRPGAAHSPKALTHPRADTYHRRYIATEKM